MMNNQEEGKVNPVSFALVHHANQFLITDGYDNRQGITEIVEGYSRLLRLHEKYRIPCNLHLSGTLVETIAWHAPWFFDQVKDLKQKGLVALIGGTYSENVMTQFSPRFNQHQLEEYLWLAERHLGCEPTSLKIAWVPERVWNTGTLSPVLTNPELANGGYQYVLLDDRLLYSAGPDYASSPRARFDETGPYGAVGTYGGNHEEQFAGQVAPAETSTVYRIKNGHGLVMIPISANIRYWVPPGADHQWQGLKDTIQARLQDGDENTLLVYADDMEKTAGIAGWDSGALERYEAFLGWMAERQEVNAVLLPDWLENHPAQPGREIEPGTFYEIAQEWKAGENYRGWSENPEWQPYRDLLDQEQALLIAAELRGNDKSLLMLAQKHLMASAYETAWHDPAENGRAPAGWARALGRHASSGSVIVAAANWFSRGNPKPGVAVVDIDGDGENEVVLYNENLYAVLSPLHGGRLIYLFARGRQGGAMLIGNPTDDWNFLEKLNDYMQMPPNHPGALVDQGFEGDRYQAAISVSNTSAGVIMTNEQAGSRLAGTRKQVVLDANATHLTVCYEMPPDFKELVMRACLSPDYYQLLREGQENLQPEFGRFWQGYRNKDVTTWLGIPADEKLNWIYPGREQVGHGLNVALKVETNHFHLLIGSDTVQQKWLQECLQRSREELHPDKSDLAAMHRQNPGYLRLNENTRYCNLY